ncbi:hypothetical protein QAD02_017444 [Eretmocerus hayati]|uniref:Uncharacterized protein n=1 Tax=Eretmocerus hayati TaxID=131215 RepID=A0ACC2PEC3_9HYME|nr:hypothetical protein QAD02_017444 [Eretmocerus hayati]
MRNNRVAKGSDTRNPYTSAVLQLSNAKTKYSSRATTNGITTTKQNSDHIPSLSRALRRVRRRHRRGKPCQPNSAKLAGILIDPVQTKLYPRISRAPNIPTQRLPTSTSSRRDDPEATSRGPHKYKHVRILFYSLCCGSGIPKYRLLWFTERWVPKFPSHGHNPTVRERRATKMRYGSPVLSGQVYQYSIHSRTLLAPHYPVSSGKLWGQPRSDGSPLGTPAWLLGKLARRTRQNFQWSHYAL